MSQENVIQGVAVALTAKTKSFDDGLTKSLAKLKGFADQAASAAGKIGGVGTALTATFGAALLLAQKNSVELTAATAQLKGAFAALNAEVATALAPVLTDLAGSIQELLKGWYSLNPAVRESVVEWGALFAITSVGLVTFGKVSTMIAGITEGLLVLKSGLGSVAGAFGIVGKTGGIALIPLIKVIAVAALVALAAGAVYRTWKTHGDAIRGLFSSIGETLMGWAAKVGDFFSGVWDSLRGFILRSATFILDGYATVIRGLAKLAKPIAEALGLDGMASVLQSASTLTGAKLLEGIKTGGELLGKAAVKAGSLVASGISYAAGGLKDAGQDLMAKAKELLGGGDGIVPTAAATGIGPDVQAPKVIASKMEAMLKASGKLDGAIAKMREKAAKDEAEAAAKALKLAADRAQRRTDFWGGVDGETGQAGGLVGQALGAAGTAGSVASGVMQGAAVAGPWGAMAGGAMALLGETDALEKLMEALQPILDALVGILDAVLMPVIKALEPVFSTVAVVLQSLTPVLEIFGMALQALDPAIKGISWVLIKVQEGLGHVTNWLIDAAAWFVGMFNQEAAKQLEGKKVDTAALNKAAEDLWKPTKKAADEMEKAADSMDTTNLPSIWRANLRMLQALDFGRQPPNVTVDVTLDGRAIARHVRTTTDRESSLARGTVSRMRSW